MEGDSSALAPPLSPTFQRNTSAKLGDRFPSHGLQNVYGPGFSSEFCCLGDACDAASFSVSSYLASGDIKQSLSCETVCDPWLSIDLFGIHLSSWCITVKEINTLFSLAKRNIATLRNASEVKMQLKFSTTDNKCFYKIRHDVCMFMNFLKAFLGNKQTELPETLTDVFKFVNTYDTFNITCKVGEEVRSLLLYTGRVSELPHHVIQAGVSRSGNDSTSALYHLFHLYLDVWWSSIVIFHILDGAYPNDSLQQLKLNPEDCNTIFPSDYVHVLIEDLILLANKRYSEISPFQNQMKVSIFPCSCVQELWVLIIQLVEYKKQGRKELFWVYMRDAFNSILTQENNVEKCSRKGVEAKSFMFQSGLDHSTKAAKCRSPVLFSLWILKNLTPLYLYDTLGTLIPTNFVPNNYFQLLKLQDYMFKYEQCSEIHLQLFLNHCVGITKYWEPSIDFMLSLSDYFLRHLDESFFQLGMTLNNFQVVYRSGLSWIEKIIENCNGEIGLKLDRSSLYMFFYLIHSHIKRIFDNSAPNLWKQFQSRMYLKLQPKKLKDLTERGLQNFFSFMLTLAHAGALEQITKKILELCNILEDQLPVSKKLVMWKALFAFIHLHIRNSSDILSLAVQVSKAFEMVSLEMAKQPKNSEYYLNLMLLCDTYLSEFNVLLDSSDHLKEQYHPFIGVGFSQLLKNGPSSKSNTLLLLVKTMLDRLFCLKDNGRLDQATRTNHRMLADNCYQHLFSYISDSLISGNASTEVMDVAAVFSKLYICHPPSQSVLKKDVLTSLFQMITESKKLPSQSICHYLQFILSDANVLRALGNKFQNLENYLVRNLLRFGACLPSNNEDLVKLTEIIFELPKVHNIVGRKLHEQSPVESIIDFFCALAGKFKVASTLDEKCALRSSVTEFMKDFVNCLEQSIRECTSVEHLRQIYKLGAYAVLHCSLLLYTRRQPSCLLPTIIDTLLLPATLKNQDKTILKKCLPFIGEYLQCFVAGLMEIGIKGDPYLERKIRSIYYQYQPYFPSQVSPLASFL